MNTLRTLRGPLQIMMLTLWCLGIVGTVTAGVLSQVAIERTDGILGTAMFMTGLVTWMLSYGLGCLIRRDNASRGTHGDYAD